MIRIKKFFIPNQKKDSFQTILGHKTSRSSTLEHFLLALLVKVYMRNKSINFGVKNLHLTNPHRHFIVQKILKSISTNELDKIISQIGEDEFDEEYYANMLQRFFVKEFALYENTLNTIITFLLLDDELKQIDIISIRKIADIFDVKEEFLNQAFKKILMPDVSNPYKFFGISKSSVTLKSLRKAYVDKVKQYHPDKFPNINYPKTFQAMLNLRMAKISDAFYQIKKEKTLSAPTKSED